MLGHKRIPSREGGIEIVVEELARADSASKGNTIRGKSVAGCYCISGLSI